MSERKETEEAELPPNGVRLSRPLLTGRGELPVLVMREPFVADQLEAQLARPDSQAASEAYLFALLCDLAPDEIGRLPLKDYLKLQGVFRGFL